MVLSRSVISLSRTNVSFTDRYSLQRCYQLTNNRIPPFVANEDDTTGATMSDQRTELIFQSGPV
jgi:hypothetical protein